MKILQKALLGLASLLIGAVVYQLGFSTLVKPWELHRSLQNGCKIVRPTFYETSLSAEQKARVMTAFTKAAWLDRTYLPLAQATALYASRTSDLVDLEANETFKAGALLYGFCLTPS